MWHYFAPLRINNQVVIRLETFVALSSSISWIYSHIHIFIHQSLGIAMGSIGISLRMHAGILNPASSNHVHFPSCYCTIYLHHSLQVKHLNKIRMKKIQRLHERPLAIVHALLVD